ncbi:hypothetical protein FRC08_011999, partial [Ceratobasidium sp. 394]
MSCCGESRKDPAPNNNNNYNSEKPPNGIINQQPTMHTGMMGGPPMHHPQPHPVSPPPLSYQPQRQSSFGPPSLYSGHQPNAMGVPPMNQFGQFGSP